jgi:hypothetical protein
MTRGKREGVCKKGRMTGERGRTTPKDDGRENGGRVQKGRMTGERERNDGRVRGVAIRREKQ